MFDFNWSEIALILVVALVLIGPKDMPIAIKAISDVIKKLRRMAGEFQGHVDEMLRDANLTEAKSTIDELRGLNLKGQMQRMIDPDSSLRRAMADPFREHPVPPVIPQPRAPLDQPAPPPLAEHMIAAAPAPAPSAAPAFIPPGAVPPAPIQPPADA